MPRRTEVRRIRSSSQSSVEIQVRSLLPSVLCLASFQSVWTIYLFNQVSSLFALQVTKEEAIITTTSAISVPTPQNVPQISQVQLPTMEKWQNVVSRKGGRHTCACPPDRQPPPPSIRPGLRKQNWVFLASLENCQRMSSAKFQCINSTITKLSLICAARFFLCRGCRKSGILL